MDAIICWDGDHIGRQVGRAVLADNVEEVRRVDQAINAGNDLWRSLALRCGGSIIEIGGDEGRIMMGAEHLSEMPAVARQYAETVGATVSVGVGMKLSDSAKALMVAKLRGGNQIVIWDPDMQREVDEASAPKTERDKLSDEYLGKAQPAEFAATSGQHQTGQLAAKDIHTGFTGTSTGSKVKGTQGDHEEGADAAKQIQDAQDEAPADPEQTHAADDFEDQLHDLAQQQGQQDQSDAQGQESHLDEVKNKLVETLTMVRQQLPIIQQLRATAPEIYDSIMALTQGLVDLGREVMGPGRAVEAGGQVDAAAADQPVQKGELEKKIEDLETGHKVRAGIVDVRRERPEGTGWNPFHDTFDYSHLLPDDVRGAGYSMEVHHHGWEHDTGKMGHERIDSYVVDPEGTPLGSVQAFVDNSQGPGKESLEPHSFLDESLRGRKVGKAMYESLFAHAKNHVGIDQVEGGIHSADAHQLHMALSKKHGMAYSAEVRPPAHPNAPAKVKENVAKYPYTPYSYTIKDELADAPEHSYIGPGKGVVFSRAAALGKAALGAQGGAEKARAHLQLPAGTVHNGQVKVQHADGKTGWKHVTSGMVQGQDADSPVLGPNSHPVSSREPGSK